MITCKIFSDLEVAEHSLGGCCLVHSVLEELAANSVLDLCCCHQMHLVIRDGSEEEFQGMKVAESRGFLSPPPVIPETAESWPSRAPEIPCPVASTALPSRKWLWIELCHLHCGGFDLAMFLLFSSQFSAHIDGILCPKLGAALQLTHGQSGRIASLLAQPSWLESPVGLIFIIFY